MQNAEHAAAEACQHEVSAKELSDAITDGGTLMPKAKPVSLHPLTFEQAIDVFIKTVPKPQKKRATAKKRRTPQDKD